MQQSYTPPAKTLQAYARLIVNFGLRNKNGTKPKQGSVVHFTVPEVAKPLYFYLQEAILKAGYQPVGEFIPSSTSEFPFRRNFFDTATKRQLEFYPEYYRNALVDQADCSIFILAPTMLNELQGISSSLLSKLEVFVIKGTKWTLIN